MSQRQVRFNETKRNARGNTAPLNREHQQNLRFFGRPPSAGFESQWASGTGYNESARDKYNGTSITNPNLLPPNLYDAPPTVTPRGWYGTTGRKILVPLKKHVSDPSVPSPNFLASRVPLFYKLGNPVFPQELPFRPAQLTNSTPVPRPRTEARHRQEDRLRNAANANELLRNINRTVRSRGRKNKTRRNR